MIFFTRPLKFHILIMLAVLLATEANGVIVASYTPLNQDATYGLIDSPSGVESAQTFRPSAGGEVSVVSVLLLRQLQEPMNIALDLYTTDAGIPESVLGTVSISSISSLYESAFYDFDFSSSGIVLSAGEQYAIVVNSPQSGAMLLVGDEMGAYADGQQFGSTFGTDEWTSLGQQDIGFRVELIPEPSAAILLFLSSASVVGFRRRNKLSAVKR